MYSNFRSIVAGIRREYIIMCSWLALQSSNNSLVYVSCRRHKKRKDQDE